jgi:Rod binding domain-containing protein
MVGPISSALPQAPGPDRPKDAREAAVQFEALLLGQMLRSAREAQESEDQTGETMWDVAAQQFAQVMAENGGIGLARLIRLV